MAGTSDDPLVLDAVAGYQTYVEEQVNQLVDDTKVLTDAVRAGDSVGGSRTPAAFDGAGRLDQGLAFVSFQRSLNTGFLAVPDRLSGEPLEEYIRTECGGYFFAFAGVESDGDHLGRALLA